MKKYKSILRFGTLQFDGHVHDYFVHNTEKLVEFYILARGGKEKNFIAIYSKGKLIVRKEVYSPRSIFVAYPVFYIQYIRLLFQYFSAHEHFFIINSLPVFFFFYKFWRIFRKYEIVYWVQDYWPMQGTKIAIFRWFMHFYHKQIAYKIYVSNRINKVMNGEVVNLPRQHTVMLGMDPTLIPDKKSPMKEIRLCFIGVLKENQGIEKLLDTVKQNKKLKLTLIGTGEKALCDRYSKMITDYRISSQVYFPNMFLYGKELENAVKKCHIGVVLYEVNPLSVTYYADPAKVKQYLEFGMPVIMTNMADISLYIRRYNAGVVVDSNDKNIINSVDTIQKHYEKYRSGVWKIAEYFEYQKYFDKQFIFLKYD